MKYFTILILAILTTNSVFAKHPKTSPLKIAQYDYFDFVDEYGKDDTSIVIIDFFLKKRSEQGIGEISFLPITTAVTLVAPPIGIVLTAAALPMAVHGGFTCVKYSKKRLSKILKKYQAGKGLSKGLTKKIQRHYKLMQLENLAVL